jgi:hypothetical protein
MRMQKMHPDKRITTKKVMMKEKIIMILNCKMVMEVTTKKL